MRVVFMGTPTLSASVLANIADAHDVIAVFTKPDAIRGRGKKLEPSPVKIEAVKRDIPVFTMTSFRQEGELARLRELAPDVICVAACSIILPAEVIGIPRFGCMNVHTSLLPRWRGAAPMQRSIMACDEFSGVSIMKMEEGLDTGAYCKQAKVPLEGVYLSELQDSLACIGSKLLLEALEEAENGTLAWTEQQEDGVTYAEKLEKGELDLDPNDPAALTCAKVRASDEAHPAHALVAQRHVIVERARVVEDEAAHRHCDNLGAGEAVFREKRLFAATAQGIIELEQLKPVGKKSMDARAFAAGIQGIKSATITWGKE